MGYGAWTCEQAGAALLFWTLESSEHACSFLPFMYLLANMSKSSPEAGAGADLLEKRFLLVPPATAATTRCYRRDRSQIHAACIYSSATPATWTSVACNLGDRPVLITARVRRVAAARQGPCGSCAPGSSPRRRWTRTIPHLNRGLD